MNYTLKNGTDSEVSETYLAICAKGQLGSELVLQGCGLATFCKFAATVMHKAVSEGNQSPGELATLFRTLGLGNASQVRQAIGALTMEIPLTEEEIAAEVAKRAAAPTPPATPAKGKGKSDTPPATPPADAPPTHRIISVETYWKSIGGAKPAAANIGFLLK